MRLQASLAFSLAKHRAGKTQSIHCEVHKLTHTFHVSSSARCLREADASPNTHDAKRRASLTQAPRWQKEVDTEAGMLSGISRKRRMRSGFYWLTEICNSQCLSHFAAPFIVV